MRPCPRETTKLRLLGDFYFKSTSYDYLIVNDAMVIAEGVGKIGATEYRFRVQGIDGAERIRLLPDQHLGSNRSRRYAADL